MVKKAVAVLLLTIFGLALAGCAGPCGFIWDEWRHGRVCQSGPEPAR